ncbi:hypothetical protein V6C53_04525 [Desulfocurvibacter africanus]|uniref:hypothetical protein n=1 Tax=Desulfocurvibacter africanus TaxID=873 RepID=UPI002FDA27CD
MGENAGSKLDKASKPGLVQIAFKTPAPALTAQVNCACAYTRRQAMLTHGLQSIFKSKML